MTTVGVPPSIAGLTFSPHRIDPGTGFRQMQISSWQGANLYEVPLTPAGSGIFTPGAVTLFVTLPQQGTGGIQYVPSGPLAGNLMASITAPLVPIWSPFNPSNSAPHSFAFPTMLYPSDRITLLPPSSQSGE